MKDSAKHLKSEISTQKVNLIITRYSTQHIKLILITFANGIKMTSTSMSTQDTQNANVMAPKFTLKLNPQVQLPLNLYIHVIDI